jgi:hypothetical protein
MQTFLPLADLKASAEVLDYRRLGRQRGEARQLIETILGHSTGWANHPAAHMWQDHVPALMAYHDFCIREWVRRGYVNNMPTFDVKAYTLPPWFGDDAFHGRHRSNLLRKDPVFYGKYDWKDDPELPYLWPVMNP